MIELTDKLIFKYMVRQDVLAHHYKFLFKKILYNSEETT